MFINKIIAETNNYYQNQLQINLTILFIKQN